MSRRRSPDREQMVSNRNLAEGGHRTSFFDVSVVEGGTLRAAFFLEICTGVFFDVQNSSKSSLILLSSVGEKFKIRLSRGTLL